jgi:NADPH2:quinone reductase
MYAIRVHDFGGPDALEWAEVDDPTPGPGEVLVEVLAAGVNPVDTYIRSGTYSLRPELPYTPGLEGCGVVRGLGAGVDGWEAGQRVIFERPRTGAYAELAAVDADRLLPAPEGLDDAQCAGFWVAYATAYRAIVQIGRARAGEAMFVHGASGNVGLAALELGRAIGLQTYGTSSTPEGRALIAARGALPFDHSAPGYLDSLVEATGGEGADVTLEMNAGTNLNAAIGVTSRRGRVMVVGSHGEVDFAPRALMGKELSLNGVMLFGMTHGERRGAAAALLGLASAGALSPEVALALPMDQAAQAHVHMVARGKRGAIALTRP